MKNILTFQEFMNEDLTSYYLKDKTRVIKIHYKGQRFWINPKEGDTKVFLYQNQIGNEKANLDKPVKDKNGKTVMLKIKDLYGLDEYPGD